MTPEAKAIVLEYRLRDLDVVDNYQIRRDIDGWMHEVNQLPVELQQPLLEAGMKLMAEHLEAAARGYEEALDNA